MIKLSQRTAVISLLALILLQVLWELWLAPIRPGGSLLVIKALLLCLPLRGLLHGRRYTFQWSSMFILAFLTEGIMRATSRNQTEVWLAAAEILLSTVFFTAVVIYSRLSRAPVTIPNDPKTD